jgi:glycosyltransferase involved in cell wall biosynthesis
MYGSWVALIGKLLHKRPVIVRCGYEWYRNTLRKEGDKIKKLLVFVFGYFFELFSYLIADQIIISNQSDKDFINKYFGIRKKKIKLLRNAIDTAVFAPQKESKKDTHNNKRMIFVGRLAQQKNLDSVIRAISNTEYGLDIVGEGKEKSKLIERANKETAKEKSELIDRANKETARVRFLGVVANDKLPEVMQKYSVFILPSHFENNPKALMEAMACELTVIGSDIESIRELVKHDVNGLLCDTDKNSIKKTVERVFAEKGLRRRLGEAARTTAVTEFDIEAILEKELSVYETVTSQ